MAKVMLAIIFASGVCLASADDDIKCALNVGRSVDEMLDSAIYIWAAVERCGKPGQKLHCEVDATEAVKSVTGMIRIIVESVRKCNGLKKHRCGNAAGKLVEGVAGLASASGEIINKCPNQFQGKAESESPIPQSKIATCIVDVKSSMKALLKAVKRMMDLEKKCDGEDDRRCAADGLSIVAALASLGEYVVGAVGKCDPAALPAATAIDMECAGAVAALVHEFDATGAAATSVSDTCDTEASRLFELEAAGKPKKKGRTSMQWALVALLPIAAVVSFAFGSRLARTEQKNTYTGLHQDNGELTEQELE